MHAVPRGFVSQSCEAPTIKINYKLSLEINSNIHMVFQILRDVQTSALR